MKKRNFVHNDGSEKSLTKSTHPPFLVKKKVAHFKSLTLKTQIYYKQFSVFSRENHTIEKNPNYLGAGPGTGLTTFEELKVFRKIKVQTTF